MSECSLNLDDIFEKIRIPIDENTTVIVYTSHLEGLGNINSDFDVYVITKNSLPDMGLPKRAGNSQIQMVRVKNVMLDIEYWSYSYLENIVKDITNNETFNEELFKALLRIRVGCIICGESLGIKLKQEISESGLTDKVLRRYIILANSNYDDALKMYKSNENICALKCAREALDNAIGALNALHGYPNLKEKWIPRIFINNNGFNNEDFLERYMKHQIFCNVNKENITDVVNELLMLTQDILTSLAIS